MLRWMKDVSTQRQSLSQISQQHKRQNVFLLLWMLVVQKECGVYEYSEADYPQVEDAQIWRAMPVVLNQIWGLHLFVYLHPSYSHFPYLWSPLRQRPAGVSSKEFTSGISQVQVCSRINRYPLEMWFYFVLILLSLFVLGLWKYWKPHLGRSIRQYSYRLIHIKFLFCTLSAPHQNFPREWCLSAFRTIWVASFRNKKPWSPSLMSLRCNHSQKRLWSVRVSLTVWNSRVSRESSQGHALLCLACMEGGWPGRAWGVDCRIKWILSGASGRWMGDK